MASKREQIITRIVSNLSAITGISNVQRYRKVGLDVDPAPFVVVRWLSEEKDFADVRHYGATLVISIDIFDSLTEGQDTETQLDQLLIDVESKLGEDEQLNGLALSSRIRELRMHDDESEDIEGFVGAGILFEVQYRHFYADPSGGV